MKVIDEIYVEPKHRNKGHATRLVNLLYNEVGEWPKTVALALEVTQANVAAKRLYTRLGFRGTSFALRRVR